MTESKEWVTIKVPKEIRDDAREDSRTYGEIMQAGLGKDVTTNGGLQSGDIDELEDRIVVRMAREYADDLENFENQLDKLQELVERVPEETAEEFGRKYR